MKKRSLHLTFAAAAVILSFYGIHEASGQSQAPTQPVAAEQKKGPPKEADIYRFGILGDVGTGGRAQYEVGKRLNEEREKNPFNLVIMLGDNMYGGESPRDFEKKFELPYADLLKAGTKFFAALGNHDDPQQQNYKGFNMNGKRYYTFQPHAGVRFFALDSNYMDKEQVAWLEKELSASGSDWKIPFFHHPLYSSGETHGSSAVLRQVLEPLFVKYQVPVVFAGHEHFYERIKPQKGITYFTLGSSAKLRKGDIQQTDLTAKGFDQDNAFMVCEIAGDTLTYRTISRTSALIDSGSIRMIK